ncbi:MAG: hypothetical protein Q8O41_01120 [Candidatus Methanoperedens sp.]|nr:hypothetical protein [Candidatus Methanoperedens sp.]
MKKLALMNQDVVKTKVYYGRYFNLFIGKDNNVVLILPKQFDENPFNHAEAIRCLESITRYLWSDSCYQDDLADLIKPLEMQIAFYKFVEFFENIPYEAPGLFNEFARYGIQKVMGEMGIAPDKCPVCGMLEG